VFDYIIAVLGGVAVLIGVVLAVGVHDLV